jgi:hypothetical protein
MILEVNIKMNLKEMASGEFELKLQWTGSND